MGKIAKAVFLASLTAISVLQSLPAMAYEVVQRNILVLMDSDKGINQGLQDWIEYQVAYFPGHTVEFAEYDSVSDLVGAIATVGSVNPIDTLVLAEHTNRHALGTGARNITDKNAEYLVGNLDRYFAPDANVILMGCLAAQGLIGNNIAKELSRVWQVSVQAPTYEYLSPSCVPGFIPSAGLMELAMGIDRKVWFNETRFRLCKDGEGNLFRPFMTTRHYDQQVLLPSRPLFRKFENGQFRY